MYDIKLRLQELIKKSELDFDAEDRTIMKLVHLTKSLTLKDLLTELQSVKGEQK